MTKGGLWHRERLGVEVGVEVKLRQQVLLNSHPLDALPMAHIGNTHSVRGIGAIVIIDKLRLEWINAVGDAVVGLTHGPFHEPVGDLVHVERVLVS